MVSRLCLGTMNFGPETTKEDSFRIMDRALELGINFFDTADVYGWQVGEGLTEQIIGEWFFQQHVHAVRGQAFRPTPVFGGGRTDQGDVWFQHRHLRSARIPIGEHARCRDGELRLGIGHARRVVAEDANDLAIGMLMHQP